MEETKKIDLGKSITDEANNCHDIAQRCRWKIQVLKEMFEAMSDQDPIQFNDHVSCFLGLKAICTEVTDQLHEIYDVTSVIKDHAEICSLDPEKVKKHDEYLRSAGIDPATGRPLYETELACLNKGD